MRSSDTVPEESSSVSVMLEESVPSVLSETLPDTSLVSLVWLEVSWVSSLLEQAAADKSSAEAISKAKKRFMLCSHPFFTEGVVSPQGVP